jgi:hypothetical protein
MDGRGAEFIFPPADVLDIWIERAPYFACVGDAVGVLRFAVHVCYDTAEELDVCESE